MSVNDVTPIDAPKLRRDAVVSSGEMCGGMLKADFQRIARLSKMQPEMIQAAFEVLVNGVALTAAAAGYFEGTGVAPSVLWRACQSIWVKRPGQLEWGAFEVFQRWYDERIEKLSGPGDSRAKRWPALILREDLEAFTEEFHPDLPVRLRTSRVTFAKSMALKKHYMGILHGRQTYDDLRVVSGPLADEKHAERVLAQFELDSDPALKLRAKRAADPLRVARAAERAKRRSLEEEELAVQHMRYMKRRSDRLDELMRYPMRQPNGARWIDKYTGDPIPDDQVQAYFERLESQRVVLPIEGEANVKSMALGFVPVKKV